MHRKRRANSNQFDWTLGKLRKLGRFQRIGLSYSDLAKVFGTSRNSIASAVNRYGLNLTPEEIRERQLQAGFERATSGSRSKRGANWETRLTEKWRDRHKGRKR